MLVGANGVAKVRLYLKTFSLPVCILSARQDLVNHGDHARDFPIESYRYLPYPGNAF